MVRLINSDSVVLLIFYTCVIIYHISSTKTDTEEYDYENMVEELEEEWNESEIRSLITYIKANELLFNKADKDFWNKGKKMTLGK